MVGFAGGEGYGLLKLNIRRLLRVDYDSPFLPCQNQSLKIIPDRQGAWVKVPRPRIYAGLR